MDAGLLLGVLALVRVAATWLGRELAIALAVLGAAVLLALAGRALYRQGWRRALRGKTARGREAVRELKDRLQRRLAEPARAVAEPTAPGPTVGVREAIEADIDAAARLVLPEAGWRRGAAKHLLRKRLDHGAALGALNGSEATHWRQLGALTLLDDPEDALTAYSRAAELSPGDTGLQLLLGLLYLQTGRLDVAEGTFREQMDSADGKDGSEATRYRAGAMLGDVLRAKGAREEALAAYEAARKEALALAEREPTDPRWRRDASVMNDRIGDVLLMDGQIDAALESFRRSLEIAQALAKDNPANPGLQHDHSVACDRVGEALEARGDLDGALESFRRGLALAEDLIKREPDRRDWHWDVSVSLDRIGGVLAAKGGTDEALSCYRRALEIAQALVASDPGRLEWQRDLAVSCHKLGMLEAQRGHEGEAREALEQGKAVIAGLARIARHQAQWNADLSKFNAALRSLERE